MRLRGKGISTFIKYVPSLLSSLHHQRQGKRGEIKGKREILGVFDVCI